MAGGLNDCKFRKAEHPKIKLLTWNFKLILLLLIFSFPVFSFAQENQPKDSLYIVTYTTGPAWDHSKAPGEQTHFSDHSKHLSSLRKEGVIKLGARAAEKGIIVFVARSMTHAKEIINSDVAIAGGLFETDIQKFNVFYPGCVER